MLLNSLVGSCWFNYNFGLCCLLLVEQKIQTIRASGLGTPNKLTSLKKYEQTRHLCSTLKPSQVRASLKCPNVLEGILQQTVGFKSNVYLGLIVVYVI